MKRTIIYSFLSICTFITCISPNGQLKEKENELKGKENELMGKERKLNSDAMKIYIENNLVADKAESNENESLGILLSRMDESKLKNWILAELKENFNYFEQNHINRYKDRELIKIHSYNFSFVKDYLRVQCKRDMCNDFDDGIPLDWITFDEKDYYIPLQDIVVNYAKSDTINFNGGGLASYQRPFYIISFVSLNRDIIHVIRTSFGNQVIKKGDSGNESGIESWDMMFMYDNPKELVNKLNIAFDNLRTIHKPFGSNLFD